MNRNGQQFEDFVRQIKFDDTPDHNHRDKLEQDLLQALARQTRQKDSPLKIWRTIMKTNIAKLATAAVIIVAVVLTVTILDRTVTPAWAIEQTAEALDQFNAVYISGVMSASLRLIDIGGRSEVVLQEDEKMSLEIWAQANEQRTESGNIKFVAGNGETAGYYDMTTYRYDPNSNTVELVSGRHAMISPWPSGNFLLKWQEMTKDWQTIYGKDAGTGREIVFATCMYPAQAQSLWFEIDLETKLPVRIKVWNNTRHEGIPAFELQRIVFFEELPDEMFEFEIPAGAKVINEREQFKLIFEDPNYGMLAEGLTEEEACKKIVEEYWEAMINEDWQRAQKLRCLPDEIWESWKAQYYDNMPAKIIEIEKPYSEKDFITTPMIITMADGNIKQGKLLVKFREIESVKSCVIVGNYGPQELNDVE